MQMLCTKENHLVYTNLGSLYNKWEILKGILNASAQKIEMKTKYLLLFISPMEKLKMCKFLLFRQFMVTFNLIWFF